jgi:SAM-dependent methyltransferase
MPVSASPGAAGSSSHRPLDDKLILTRIKQQFNGRAANYDSVSNNYHTSLAQQLLRLCELQPGQRVLDLAAGTGIAAVLAAPTVAPGNGHVVALDICGAMLEQARQKAAAAGVAGSIDIIEGGGLTSCHPTAQERQRAVHQTVSHRSVIEIFQQKFIHLVSTGCSGGLSTDAPVNSNSTRIEELALSKLPALARILTWLDCICVCMSSTALMAAIHDLDLPCRDKQIDLQTPRNRPGPPCHESSTKQLRVRCN